jgi:hypothetical protein
MHIYHDGRVAMISISSFMPNKYDDQEDGQEEEEE